jgi:DNA-binding GntR family transcriptional regulator
MGEKAADGQSDLFFSKELADDAPPIARRHLHDELRERLRGAIIAGELEPNAKVPEKELCERFGVSRTPLREALKVLAHEGLVILNHNRGATVAPLTVHDLEEALPVYAHLEALAGELACARATAEEIGEVRRLHDQMVRHYRDGDLKRCIAFNDLIHERIQLASHNATLIQILGTVSGTIRRARCYASAMDPHLAEAMAEHESIMDALEARDGMRLAMLLRAHMNSALDYLRTALAPRSAAAVEGGRPWLGAVGAI